MAQNNLKLIQDPIPRRDSDHLVLPQIQELN